MIEDIAASVFLICMVIVGGCTYFGYRSVTRKRRERRDLEIGMELVSQGKYGQLTPHQRDLCMQRLYDRYALRGSDAVKAQLEKLEELRFNQEGSDQ